ncbi:hypothetical protein RB195_008202 [Necator americanus]|uniref:Uncharacterized protein n=1 Tax=Necator americanus TaxID=51031 RepID=A0ABR1CNX6_NECAM
MPFSRGGASNYQLNDQLRLYHEKQKMSFREGAIRESLLYRSSTRRSNRSCASHNQGTMPKRTDPHSWKTANAKLLEDIVRLGLFALIPLKLPKSVNPMILMSGTSTVLTS